jgi:hypothetical protein
MLSSLYHIHLSIIPLRSFVFNLVPTFSLSESQLRVKAAFQNREMLEPWRPPVDEAEIDLAMAQDIEGVDLGRDMSKGQTLQSALESFWLRVHRARPPQVADGEVGRAEVEGKETVVTEAVVYLSWMF